MVVKSLGKHRRTREKFRRPKKLTINDYLREFDIGQYVAIKIQSNSRRGQPFRRFHGRTGKIIGKKGKSYIVEINDGKKLKQIISAPEHIKPVKV